ncbi:hypothetical protein F4803DRAFT_509159 [Xylaria telfairii]|nr:hypothetical protein F4803DRAFT_509159 [Xylaria telfairii]
MPFAVRSGGHSPHPDTANINDGVLIDLSMINELDYDAKAETVTIGAGLRWQEVYPYLDQFNVTVVGGRMPAVGVGGLILGDQFFNSPIYILMYMDWLHTML